jgi:hypothetical protein
MITIADNDLGIPEEKKAKNFAPILYDQTDRSRNWYGIIQWTLRVLPQE